MKRILAIDYGQSRVGTAVSDALRLFSTPYKTLKNEGYLSLLDSLKEIIRNEDIGTIVVGLPTYNDGSHSPQTLVVSSFIDKITKDLEIEVVSFDERYSSAEAKSFITSGDVQSPAGKQKHHSTKKRNKITRLNKDKVDRFAASIILQNYLDETEKEAGK